MEETELEVIDFPTTPQDKCRHRFERLLFIPIIPDYGPTVQDARVRKCFKCGLVLAEEE